MHCRLQVPLEYVRVRHGFRYSDDSFKLPASWIDEQNVLFLALAVRLAFTIPDRAIKDDLCRLMAKLPAWRVPGNGMAACSSCKTGFP